jgi:hypothetical protein
MALRPLLLSLLLFGCAPKDAQVFPVQQWQDLIIRLEVRPNPVTQGANEFLLIAEDTAGRPGYKMIVSLRIKGNSNWRQAIQDGHSGVYRRALVVRDVRTEILEVGLKSEDADTVLNFPLQP